MTNQSKITQSNKRKIEDITWKFVKHQLKQGKLLQHYNKLFRLDLLVLHVIS
jgi:hypothetical protein